MSKTSAAAVDAQNQDDDILAELRGSNASGTLIDAAPDNSANLRDPLETVPEFPLKTPAIVKADAVHSTKAGGKGYAVTVKGDYYAPSVDQPGKKVKKPYEVVVNVPSLDSAMSIIRRQLLTPAIMKLDPQCSGPRTYEIVSARPLSAQTPESTNLQFMPRHALESHIALIKAPIRPSEYADVTVLRAAVIDFSVNPTGFEKREAEKQALRAETDALALLNPDLVVVPAE